MPSPLSWGIGRAATLLKTLLQYYGKSLPGVAYPGVRDNRSTVNTKTGYDKKSVNKSEALLTNNKRLCLRYSTADLVVTFRTKTNRIQ